jgi:serine/threonine-protein kinase
MEIPMIGQNISHYKILEKLGEGGMGVVYRAHDTKLDRDVALKFLPLEFTKDPEAKERFVHEGKAASSLQHTNICTIHDTDATGDGQLFIVMDYYEGETLKKKIEQGPLKIDNAIETAIQVAQGLAKAHEKDIVHRDIKPANVLITTDGVVKILDFGLAKLRGLSKLTKTGSTLGTAPYMSPEQARGETVDHRADVWSLGVVLYEMLTGQLPFKGDYEQAITYQIVNALPEPITGLRSGVPMELERIVNKCLEKNPGERYQTAVDLIADLKHLQRTTSQSAVSSITEKKINSTSKYRILSVAAAILVIVIGLMIIFKPFSKGPVLNSKSIAVLPFKNMSDSKEDEYFSDGITEDILTQLSKIADLKVISRTSVMQYKNTTKSLKEIGRELNVATLLEGSVRRADGRIRIVGQLVDAQSDEHLWADSYDREMKNVLDIQSDVAQRIAKALKLKLTPGEKERLKASASINPDAYNAFLQGKYFSHQGTKEGLEKAIKYYEQALAIDARYAVAWVGLSIAHSDQGDLGRVPVEEAYRKAREENEKGLELDPNLAEAYAQAADIKMNYDWDWAGADALIEHALVLAPGNADVNVTAAGLAVTLGKLDEAIRLQQRGTELDPLQIPPRHALSFTYYVAGRYDEAEEEIRKCLEISPQHILLHYVLSLIYLQKSKLDVALTEIQNEPELSYRMTGQAIVYFALGRRRESDSTLELLIKEYNNGMAYQIAEVYAYRNEPDKAFEWLERAYKQRDGGLCSIKYDPLLRNIRYDSRYKEFLKKMKLNR